ncbi:hornerin-like [Iris pallida]|uniref:Hornerin-like n=1 Tax=Iris pallida TaxID=29817 RepID=A0AAX6FV28_IRIPA|nr:hornerin-like [Iris pallida]
MEQCRQGKSAKRIRNFGKRIGSEDWARGSQPRTRRLSADCSSCSRGESGSPRAGRGTDWERPPLAGGLPRASNSRLRTGTDKGNPTV